MEKEKKERLPAAEVKSGLKGKKRSKDAHHHRETLH